MPLKEKFLYSKQYALDFLEMAEAAVNQIREHVESGSSEKAVKEIGEEFDGRGAKFHIQSVLETCRDMTKIGKLLELRTLDALKHKLGKSVSLRIQEEPSDSDDISKPD